MREDFSKSHRLLLDMDKAIRDCYNTGEWMEIIQKMLVARGCNATAVDETLDQYRDRKMDLRTWERLLVRLSGNYEKLKDRPVSAQMVTGDYAEKSIAKIIGMSGADEGTEIRFMPMLGAFAGAVVKSDKRLRVQRLLFMTKSHKDMRMREELLGMFVSGMFSLKDGLLFISDVQVPEALHHRNSAIRGYRRMTRRTAERCPRWMKAGSCFRCNKKQLPEADDNDFSCRYAVH